MRRYPTVFKAFEIAAFIVAVVLLVLFFYHLYRIFQIWNMVIARHRFLFSFSFYFIILLFFLVSTGIYQSYDNNGIKVLLLFVSCNLYVIVLQVTWRFAGDLAVFDGLPVGMGKRPEPAAVPPQRNYFDNVQVQINRKDQPLDSSNITSEFEDIESRRPPATAFGFGTFKEAPLISKPNGHGFQSESLPNDVDSPDTHQAAYQQFDDEDESSPNKELRPKGAGAFENPFPFK